MWKSENLTCSSWRRSWRCCWRWCWWGRPGSSWRSAGWWLFASSGGLKNFLFPPFIIRLTPVKRSGYKMYFLFSDKWSLLTTLDVRNVNRFDLKDPKTPFLQNGVVRLWTLHEKRKCQKYPICIIPRTEGNWIELSLHFASNQQWDGYKVITCDNPDDCNVAD